ncbi:IPT/TIG domain-containing protein [Rufibacter ruber]|uniref:IPT/TIG domain-containing protein n=1 Tax=Rufibacter ruber TaxID=1783499 RepID=UPI00082BD132|nr:IPT/TIG domain-containing protein [Rufibacter ruber]
MKHWFTRRALFLKNTCFFTSLVILGLCLTSTPPAWAQDACSLLPLPLEERMQQATLVVEGQVLSSRSFWDSRHENIYTAHQVEVYKVFKGLPSAGTVEVITEGGQVGLDLHVYSATLKLQPQQQGVFFLQPAKGTAGQPQFSVYGSLQGFIQYQLPQGTARDPFARYASIPQQLYPALTRLPGAALRAVKTNVPLEKALKQKPDTNPAPTQRRLVPSISDFSPKSLRAGTGDVLTITGNNFGASRGNGYVEFKNADDGGATYIKPLPTDYVSWSNTEIKVLVPTAGLDNGTAGSGVFRVASNEDATPGTSLTQLVIQYAHTNVLYKNDSRNMPERSYMPRLINQNGRGGYTFRFGASFETNKPALYAFKQSMNEWSCNTFVNWDVASNAAVARTADDKVNSVRFVESGELPANVLGRCISRYTGCLTGSDVTFWAREMDLEFAQRPDWQYGPGNPSNQQFDFHSVVLHELGHGHQLSHLILPRAVMHYAVARAQISRSLNATNDIAGGNYVMNLSVQANGCDAAPMVRKPTSACAIPVKLLPLQGQYQPADNTVLLQWGSETEENLVAYAIERSTNGSSFTEIARVTAGGTSTTPRTYQFTDDSPLANLAYYRLRLIKGNGNVEYSEAVEIMGPSFTQALSPNPGGATTFLYFESPEVDQLEMAIFDPSGRRYSGFTILVVPQVKRYELTLPGIARGLFLIRWQSKNGNGVFRYLKLE